MALKLNGTNSVAAPAYAGADADTGLQCGTDELKLVTGGTARLTVDSSGNVDIAGGLEVTESGTDKALRLRYPGDSSNSARTTFEVTASVAGSETAVASIKGDGSAYFNGNVGIGASSPVKQLQVGAYGSSSEGTIALASTTSGTGSILMGDGGTGTDVYRGYLQYDHSADAMLFATSASEQMRINASGDVLVNTTSTLSAGLVSIAFDTSRNGMTLKPLNSTLNQNYLVFINSAGTTAGKIEQNGTTSTNYVTSSDYRLKENIVDLDGAITRVKQLAPKRFNFIGEADRTVDGFLAHEAQTVVPEAISGTHNGVEVWKEGEELPAGVSVGDNKLDEDGNTIPDYQGIDQSKLVPLLTAALQEAISKIETLETQNTAQQAQIDDLLARVTALEAAS